MFLRDSGPILENFMSYSCLWVNTVVKGRALFTFTCHVTYVFLLFATFWKHDRKQLINNDAGEARDPSGKMRPQEMLQTAPGTIEIQPLFFASTSMVRVMTI